MSLLQRLRGRVPVKMLVSYGGERVAGETYFLSRDEASILIAKRYAVSSFTPDMSSEEVEALLALDQTVGI